MSAWCQSRPTEMKEATKHGGPHHYDNRVE
jgi:hypothetical protein